MAGRLDDEAIAPTNVFLDLDEQLAVGKQFRRAAAERDLQVVANLLRQHRVGPTGEDLDFVCV